jgi:hypothetical protein
MRPPDPISHPAERPAPERGAPHEVGRQVSDPFARRIRPDRPGFEAGLNRSERIRLARSARIAVALFLLAIPLTTACGRDSEGLLAGRVLEDYRRKASVRPLPPTGSVRVRLTPDRPAGGESGSEEIEWEGAKYRETVTSAGVSTIRGIQGGKAFFTDEDGVTRVGSEPMLAELTTRSYFWRRAFLFEDRERAKLSLGPADESTVSLLLHPLGGNPLRVSFDRRSSALKSVLSPRFHLEFESRTRYRDASRMPVAGDITWAGLPTRRLPDRAAGGWQETFSEPVAEAELSQADGGIWVPARISGIAARLAIDTSADGPMRVSPELARKAGLSGRRDVFGRLLAAGAALEIGPLTMPSLLVEIADPEAPGVDAVAGGTLYREMVVEIDPSGKRLRLHDPALWVPPDGFGRSPLDDDGDLPVAILSRTGKRVRLRAGTRAASPLLLPSRSARDYGIDPSAPVIEGLVWGILRLPPLPVRLETSRFDPDWGDDGAIGYTLLLRFHVIVDMPHRWVYVKPL